MRIQVRTERIESTGTRRWDLQKPYWTAYTLEEWDAITAHVHASDIPETTSRWHELGHKAGFSDVREVFTAGQLAEAELRTRIQRS